jgi:hypothetical protein
VPNVVHPYALAKLYNVDKKTLNAHIKRMQDGKDAPYGARVPRRLLTIQQEESLANVAVDLAQAGYPLQIGELKDIVKVMVGNHSDERRMKHERRRPTQRPPRRLGLRLRSQ